MACHILQSPVERSGDEIHRVGERVSRGGGVYQSLLDPSGWTALHPRNRPPGVGVFAHGPAYQQEADPVGAAAAGAPLCHQAPEWCQERQRRWLVSSGVVLC